LTVEVPSFNLSPAPGVPSTGSFFFGATGADHSQR
jgi:hypothetical protein